MATRSSGSSVIPNLIRVVVPDALHHRLLPCPQLYILALAVLGLKVYGKIQDFLGEWLG
jgi:hypothetical protein